MKGLSAMTAAATSPAENPKSRRASRKASGIEARPAISAGRRMSSDAEPNWAQIQASTK